MGKKVINRGVSANDGSGDNLRAGALKINENFDEIYTALGDGSTLLSGTYVTTGANQVLANKTINGNNNTITNIPSSALSSLPNSKLDLNKLNEQVQDVVEHNYCLFMKNLQTCDDRLNFSQIYKTTEVDHQAQAMVQNITYE